MQLFRKKFTNYSLDLIGEETYTMFKKDKGFYQKKDTVNLMPKNSFLKKIW